MTTNTQTPPRLPPRIKSAPKIKQVYWCDFPEDAQLPEFWKCRPVIILSYKNTLSGAVTVIPCTTQDQNNNKWGFHLSTTLDDGNGWAICDKPTTVAVSRLSIDKEGIKNLPDDEFNEMLSLVLKWLPKPL